MFHNLGKIVERWWPGILVAWFVLMVAATCSLNGWINRFNLFDRKIPTWTEVSTDGEFMYLPADMQSLVGEKLLATAFPSDLLTSSIVIVVRRESRPLVEKDEKFIEEVLRPRLEEIREREGSLISRIKTFKDPLMGKLLESEDGKASLVILALTSEFLQWRNRPTIEQIEKLLYTDLPREQKIPLGLDLAMSGTATVGRDMLEAAADSAKRTELWTTILVVTLLVVIYRAPILALIPLMTVFVSVQISKALLVLLTQVPGLNFHVFKGMEVYITVVVYGAGVDYCLFLIARYKEELDSGLGFRPAIGETLTRIGATLTASAGTVICGIFMMVFAQFGKFREAGIGIAFSLCVVLCGSLTFTPSLLRLAGRWAFWPYGRLEPIAGGAGWISGTSLISRFIERNRVHLLWERMGKVLVQKPGTVLAVCICAMTPFAFVGVWFQDWLSYGLLSELQPSRQSVIGAKAVQSHFPAGFAGALTILVKNDKLDFTGDAGREKLKQIIDPLAEQRETLGIADIRRLSQPLGVHRTPDSKPLGENSFKISGLVKKRREALERQRAQDYYVSSADGAKGHVSRVDVIFRDDPFSRESVGQLNAVERVLRDRMPPDLADTKIMFVGPTASIRDLKTVTDHDQIRIDLLVLAAVFVILVWLLGKPAVSLYLIASVFFSYLVTLGVSFTVFWWLDPEGFAGLDWKVPMFLFTILISIGEDYNIFLMTRIEEEQTRHGAVEGVRIALLRTGSIISSCGIIMAGTFMSLMAGTLVGMQQLGFALAFGVLLDTFVVRPLLVPAYLVLLYSGRFGAIGRFLGHSTQTTAPDVTGLKNLPPEPSP